MGSGFDRSRDGPQLTMTALPDGFVLDAPTQPAGLPDGFVLDQPSLASAAQGVWNDPSAPVPGQVSIPIPGIGQFKPSLVGMAKGLFSGATLPGDVAAGRVDPLSNEGIGRAANLAGGVALGTTGAPAGALGSGMVRPAAAMREATRVTPEEVMAAGAAGKKQAQSSLVAIDPKEVENFVAKARNDLASDSKPRSLAGGVHDTLDELESSAKAAQAAGQPMSANDMVGFRGTLTAFTKTPSNNSAAAGMAKGLFDKWLETSAPTLAPQIKDYVSNFRTGYLGQDIANKTNRATYGAAASNSGMNIENKLRQSLVSIVADKRKLGRYAPETQDMMKQAVNGTLSQNGMRKLGNLLGGGGGLAAALFGMGGMLTHPALALAPIAGWGIKTLGNRAQLGKLDAIGQSALASSPYALQKQAMAAPIQPQLSGGLLGTLARNPQGLLPLGAPQRGGLLDQTSIPSNAQPTEGVLPLDSPIRMAMMDNPRGPRPKPQLADQFGGAGRATGAGGGLPSGSAAGKLKSLSTDNAAFDTEISRLQADKSIDQPTMRQIAKDYLGYDMAKSKPRSELIKMIKEQQMLEQRGAARGREIDKLGPW